MQIEGTDRQRILIIDDDELVRELLGALLGVQNFEVTSALSGAAALAVLRSPDPPSMILTDLQMPGLEGEALTHTLRAASGAGTILIGMSGRRPDERTLEPLDGFLLKPFDARTLTSTFATAVEARTRTEQQAPAEPGDTVILPAGYPVLDETIFSALGTSFQPAQLHEFYAMTLRDVQSRFERMTALAAEGDLEEVRREAHAIKGGCGMVGARELQQLAHSLERGTTLDTGVLNEIPLACHRLQAMLDKKLQQKW